MGRQVGGEKGTKRGELNSRQLGERGKGGREIPGTNPTKVGSSKQKL